MNSPLFEKSDLKSLDHLLSSGIVVLVPNFQCARQLQDAFFHFRKEPINELPNIQAVDLWINDLWQKLAQDYSDPRLYKITLNSSEEQRLWLQVISEAGHDWHKQGSARLASMALRTMLLWETDLSHLRHSALISGDDKQAGVIFSSWAEEFNRLCLALGVQTQSAMLLSLIGMLEETLELPKGMEQSGYCLYGFDDPPPAYIKLFNTLEKLGLSRHSLHFIPCKPLQRIISCPSLEEEIAQATEWAEQLLRDDPNCFVGIISPDTASTAGIVGTQWRRQNLLSRKGLVREMRSLADHSLGNGMLLCLNFAQHTLNTLEISSLLRSPWLSKKLRQSCLNDKLDYILRQNEEQQIPVSHFIYQLQSLKQSHPDNVTLIKISEAVLLYRQQNKKSAEALNYWLEHFNKLWDAFFPNDEIEATAPNDFLKTLQDFKTKLFTSVIRPEICTFAEALLYVREAIFNYIISEQRQSAPVMLLSPTEAAGLHFTHCWVLQMNESQWPIQQNPTQLLPLNFQKQHQMPGTNRSSELAKSKAILHGLTLSTTNEVCYSYSRYEDDQEQLSSGLLPDLTHEKKFKGKLPRRMHPSILKQLGEELEYRPDESRLPLLPSSNTTGGASLLGDQADCSFRAFGKHRLKTTPLAEPSYGLSHSAGGLLLHKIFEYLWNRLHSSDELLSLGEVKLNEIVLACIENAIDEIAKKHPMTMLARYKQLQSERLHSLVLRFLELEKQRSPFIRGGKPEQDLFWKYNNLTLSMRSDRIDLQEGEYIVVDYKSSKSRPFNWLDQRLTDPQLPLYALAIEQAGMGKVAGILHAWVHHFEPKYTGVCRDPESYPKLGLSEQKFNKNNLSWNELLTLWETHMSKLAESYLNGDIRVNPLNTQSCRYCHLKALCRISERDPDRETQTEAAQEELFLSENDESRHSNNDSVSKVTYSEKIIKGGHNV